MAKARLPKAPKITTFLLQLWFNAFLLGNQLQNGQPQYLHQLCVAHNNKQSTLCELAKLHTYTTSKGGTKAIQWTMIAKWFVSMIQPTLLYVASPRTTHSTMNHGQPMPHP